ncbi:uncharacterized protein LOC108682750 [Hyalella azteca]|uniref:Uncharacterized protein LOC108682750 n=1 Tax=Hyalella azteca TaxID=294128 RepID=A0A8B7PMR6_HYAAZ|nr:uncharacterized protein LOC108682750 [Hyalella azteca]
MASAAGIAATASFEEMRTICQTHEVIMTLCPKYTSKLLALECKDKDKNVTYKTYLEKCRGQTFTQTEWKKLCGFLGGKFETEKDPDNFDMTAQDKLFKIMFDIKKDGRNSTDLLNKVKAVKDIRNDLMHDAASMKDPNKVHEIKDTLIELIEEGGSFYSLPTSETEDMKHELQHNIDNCFSIGNKQLAHVTYLALTEGKRISDDRVQKYFNENLPLDLGCVKRSEVFYSPKVMPSGQNKKPLPYTKIFDSQDRVIIVVGVVGAGKTNVLKNIALQFSALPSNIPDFLKGFEVLVYIECRDRTMSSLQQVFMEHFEGLFTEPGEKASVLQAVKQLHVLFLVDGFDEVNDMSMTVLRELLKTKWHSNSRILITSRPQAFKEVKTFVTNNDATFNEYRIAPLSELHEQLEFIEKYGRSLNEDPARAHAMRDRFARLDPELQKFFTEPINLLHFCSIFNKTPKNIDRWRSFNDLSRDVLALIKAVVAGKLCDIAVPDKDVLIDDLIMVVGKCALDFLSRNQVTFADHEILRLKRQCIDKMKPYGASGKFDTGVFLSTMLKEKRLLSGGTTYSFEHKSVQEAITAHYVVGQLIDTEEPLKNILGTTNSSLLEVLLYVAAELSTRSPSQFQRRWGQLKEALRDAGIDTGDDNGDDVRDCIARCPDHVAGLVAELAVLAGGGSWHVENDMHTRPLRPPGQTKFLFLDRPRQPSPLPSSPPPELCVEGVEEGSWEADTPTGGRINGCSMS